MLALFSANDGYIYNTCAITCILVAEYSGTNLA